MSSRDGTGFKRMGQDDASGSLEEAGRPVVHISKAVGRIHRNLKLDPSRHTTFGGPAPQGSGKCRFPAM